MGNKQEKLGKIGVKQCWNSPMHLTKLEWHLSSVENINLYKYQRCVTMIAWYDILQ